MRIATLVTSKYALCPTSSSKYPPLTVALQIAEGLKRRGHEITFYAPGGGTRDDFPVVSGDFSSQLVGDPMMISGENHSNPNQLYMTAQFDLYLTSLLYQDAVDGTYDLIHMHAADTPHALVPFPKIPTVFTLHDLLLPWRERLYGYYAHKNRHLIPISQAQADVARSLDYGPVIHHGVDLHRFKPSSHSAKNSLLFVGRMVPEKGPDLAAEAAQGAGVSLRLVGKQYKQKHEGYWDTAIAPKLSDTITYEGELYATEDTDPIPSLYASAKAIIAPLQWEEPFGLIFAEALACGTPVITFRRGSVPEIIDDGVTGFTVPPQEGVAGLTKAIERLYALDTNSYKAMCAAARRTAKERFSLERMVNDYDQYFMKLAP